MKTSKRTPSEQAFADLLEGKLEKAPRSLVSMARLASALRQDDLPIPDARFRARLRSQLLAQASASEEDLFAMALEGSLAEAPKELASLAAFARGLEHAEVPGPSPAFRFQLRNALVAKAQTAAPAGVGARLGAWNDRMRRSFRSVLATGMAAVMMMGAGAALAASQSAVPGDALFGLKRLHENAQLVAVSGVDEGLRKLSFARERLEEVRALADAEVSDPRPYILGLNLMDRLTVEGATTLLDAFKETGRRGPLESALSFAEAQAQDLSVLIDRLPASAQPIARDSLAQAERVATRLDDALRGCPCFTAETPSNPLVTGPQDDVSCACDPAPGGPAGGTTGGPSGTGDDNDGSGGNGGDGDGDGGDGDGDSGDGGGDGADNNVDVPSTGNDTIDDTVDGTEDVIQEIIDTLPSPLPSVLPTISPSVSAPPLP